MTLRVRAPGKVVLLGEYAVLDGAPAIVAAVDRGVECAFEPGAEAVTIETPGGDDRFARAALSAVDAPSGTYRFRDTRPPDVHSKAGLGGSAAATAAAALIGRLARDAPPTTDQLFDTAYAVHRAVQGSGSGIDVAAAVYGGVLRYQDRRAEPYPPVDPVVVWSGSSARTGPRVDRYLAWPDRAAFAAESARLVERFADDPIGATSAAGELLSGMAERAGIAYWTPGLRQVAELATTHGGAAKPSGAGGGDCAVALFPSPERAAAFRAACARHHLTVIPTALAPGTHAVTSRTRSPSS